MYYDNEAHYCNTMMNKVSVSIRLPELLLGKIQKIAEKQYRGDRTATLVHLVTLGVQALEEGKKITPPKYDLPEELILALEAEVKKEVKRQVASLEVRLQAIQTNVEVLQPKKK